MTKYRHFRANFYVDLAYENNVTVCMIEGGELGIGFGVTVCSPKDNFSRPDGRAQSLGRAQVALTESERCTPTVLLPPLHREPIQIMEAIHWCRYQAKRCGYSAVIVRVE